MQCALGKINALIFVCQYDVQCVDNTLSCGFSSVVMGKMTVASLEREMPPA